LEEANRLTRPGIWRWDCRTHAIEWSDEVFRLQEIGRSGPLCGAEENGRAYSAESAMRLDKAVERAIDLGEPYEIDLEVLQKDGSTRWISVRGEVETIANGMVASLCGTLHDITDRKRAEERLALSESRYRTLVEAAAAIMWIAPPDGAQAGEMPQWRAFTGQSREEVTGFGWSDAIHSDDRDRIVDAWRQSLSDCLPFETKHRLRRHDGVYRTMAVRAAPVRDRLGRVVEWVGMHIDITETEQAQEILRRAEREHAASLILSSSPIAMIVTDPMGLITTVNPAAETLLRFSKEALVGRQTPLILLDTDAVAMRAEALSRELQQPVAPGLAVLTAKPERGLVEQSEWVFRRGDGSRFDAQLTISAMAGPAGQLSGLILIADDITERKRAADTIAHLADHDALTGLPTRRVLDSRLASALEWAARNQGTIAVLIVDLDDFKRVNDQLGHLEGDRLIAHVAQCLRHALPDTHTVARQGGDEFAVVLHRLADASQVLALVSRLIASLHVPLVLGAQRITPRACIGVSIYPDGGETVEALLKNADAAMYEAKRDGKNGVRVFTRDMSNAFARRRQVEAAMAVALAAGEFELVYQPQISLLTGQVIGVEALMRWQSATLGNVAPAEFIPIAESNGLIDQIGAWALHTACAFGHRLQWAIGHPLVIAVNVSPRQFECDKWPETVRMALKESQLSPQTLELEITENILVNDSSKALRNLQAVRALGIRIGIDDFGTGYCSLSYIMRFSVDRLKIDKSFIHAMTPESDGTAVSTAIISLGRSLEIDVIAEGIETSMQHEQLLALQCQQAQGYLYACPAKARDLIEVIRTMEAAAAVRDYTVQPPMRVKEGLLF
jgi:diguanylate cyclase (GGDEF)-like protein/PAS domain S-box-containing protein